MNTELVFCAMCISIRLNKDLSYRTECCLGLIAGAVGGSEGSEVMHRDPLLDVPELVCPHCNGEEKMTSLDFLGYSKARKKRVKVKEGGVVAVHGAQTGL